jgi:proteasome lid subunit RPN8/RPN11
MRLDCPLTVLESTLEWLRQAGESKHEGIVLFLGRRGDDGGVTVLEAYRPEHFAEADRFHIPRESMAVLMEHLRRKRLMVAAQVHSHPGTAFHSAADDGLAIVRHLGALSFVVPRFAKTTTPENFLRESAAYELNSVNRWLRLTAEALEWRCRIG